MISAASPLPETFRLCCMIEDEEIVFGVTGTAKEDVSRLKEKIHSTRDLTLKDVDQHTLELWKVCAS